MAREDLHNLGFTDEEINLTSQQQQQQTKWPKFDSLNVFLLQSTWELSLFVLSFEMSNLNGFPLKEQFELEQSLSSENENFLFNKLKVGKRPSMLVSDFLIFFKIFPNISFFENNFFVQILQ
jgi:hypothetical protein